MTFYKAVALCFNVTDGVMRGWSIGRVYWECSSYFFSSTLAGSSRSPSSIFSILTQKVYHIILKKNVLEMSEIQKGGLFFAFLKKGAQ
jgi:hypothetical protein